MPCKIKYIKASKSGATYLLGLVRDGEDARYKIPARLYHELGEPMSGATLTDEELSEIKIADEGGACDEKGAFSPLLLRCQRAESGLEAPSVGLFAGLCYRGGA